MASKVLKYRLGHLGMNVLELPKHTELLHVAEQDHQLTLWALVDEDWREHTEHRRCLSR